MKSKKKFQQIVVIYVLIVHSNEITFIHFYSGRVANISPRAGHRFEGLNGPSYKLNNQQHPLPNPKALKVIHMYNIYNNHLTMTLMFILIFLIWHLSFEKFSILGL